MVDRSVAKVVVTNDIDESKMVNGAAIGSFNWRADIKNKQMFWMRKFAYKAGNTDMEGMNDLNRYHLYAEDPNFYQGDTGSAESENGGNYNKPWMPYEYITESNVTKPGDDSEQNYDYVTENTMDTDQQYEDVTTRVVLKINHAPESVGPGKGYFVFRTELVPEDIMAEYVKNPITAPDDLKAILTAEFIVANFDTTTGKVKDGTASFSKNGLKYYKDGISYYSIPIRHFNDAQAPLDGERYGRYGVVRNNLYKISAQSITFPGEPNIPESVGPDDKEREYISFKIEVQDWYVRNQDVVDL